MALNQFLTFVIPRKSIEEKYSGIPKQLEIKHTEWEKYWENYDVELNEAPDPDFEDAISIKWWKNINVDIKRLEREIDQLITRKSWGNPKDLSWKSETLEFDHDVSIDFNEKENYIEDFRFRTDLTDTTLIFLKSILDLCNRNDWILMDEKGNLSEPRIRDLAQLIKGSNADRYLRNPNEFFENLK